MSNMNEGVLTDAETEAIILCLFDTVTDAMIQDPANKKTAHRLAQMYFGERVTENSNATMVMLGFLGGMAACGEVFP